MSNHKRKWNQDDIYDFDDYYDNLYNNLTVPDIFVSMNLHKNRNPESDRNILPNRKSEIASLKLQKDLDKNQHNQTPTEIIHEVRYDEFDITSENIKGENTTLYKGNEKFGVNYQQDVAKKVKKRTDRSEIEQPERGSSFINKLWDENISLYRGNEKYGNEYQIKVAEHEKAHFDDEVKKNNKSFINKVGEEGNINQCEKNEVKQINPNHTKQTNDSGDNGGDAPNDGNDVLQSNDSISKSGTVVLRDGKYTIRCLTIIGQIEGHYLLPDSQKSTKYEHILPMLVAAEESTEIEGLLILINTVGGDIEAGLAIAEMIASMKKPTASIVLGGGHSIGVPLAVSAKRSFIVPSAIMTLHPVRMTGMMIGAPQTYFYLNRMQDRIIRFITEHSNVSADRLRSLIMKTDELASDLGSIVEGKEAVKEGLICEVGGLREALGFLKSEIDKKRAEKEKS